MTVAGQIRRVSPDELPLSLLLEADPSEEKIRGYLPFCRCYALIKETRMVGVAAVIPQQNGLSESLLISDELNSEVSGKTGGIYELMNIAVDPNEQGSGYGSELLKYVIEDIRQEGGETLTVGTGTFGYQLTFYQRAGFRVIGVETDFFLQHYPEPLWEYGLQHKDMLRLAINLNSQ